MTTDERLMFALTKGYLRKWSLWNETTYPKWATGEETKWQLFQSWRLNPQKNLEDGTIQYHPMSEFENWPYWLIIDLCRYVFRREPFEGLMAEPDNLKETICDVCDDRYSNSEKQTFQQAV